LTWKWSFERNGNLSPTEDCLHAQRFWRLRLCGNGRVRIMSFTLSPLNVRISFMKLQLVLLLSLIPFVLVGAMSATVPDACGNEKVSFDIHFQKNAPAPGAPEAGKGQVIFVEKSKKPPTITCLDSGVSCNDVARFGVDGAWVGATKGNSYLPISLEPGVHHLCAVVGKDVHAEPLTVEAGHAYYFQVEYKAEGRQYGTAKEPNYQVEKNVSFSMLNEDEGKYRVKASALSVATPKHP
jgi:hypothetical protein